MFLHSCLDLISDRKVILTLAQQIYVRTLLQAANFFMLTGSYDKCVTAIRERNKDDMAAVTATIFSHAQVKGTSVAFISAYEIACF